MLLECRLCGCPSLEKFSCSLYDFSHQFVFHLKLEWNWNLENKGQSVNTQVTREHVKFLNLRLITDLQKVVFYYLK